MKDLHAPFSADTAETEAWAQQDALLQTLHADSVREPLPEAWVAQARQAGASRARARRIGRLGAMTLMVVLAFASGWWSHGGLPGNSPALIARHFAQDAALAHAVYTPETRHPVEVTAAQHDHLVQWLSRRLGRSLQVPHLEPFGYQLVGGRLLPGDEGARAQFMFENDRQLRLTLYIGGLPSEDSTETAFRFSDDRGVARFYWVEQGTGYALAGALPRAELLALAQTVHQQLSAASPGS